MTGSDHCYANEVAYTYGYCDELNPLRAKLPLLNAGLEYPVIRNACELGFGQGVSLNLHSAGAPIQWYGVDADPRHTGFARQLADDAQTHPQLWTQRFSEFCLRDDLPDFEFIGLHGVWSWISDADRATITDFVARKLKTGGVLYMSYNTQPGWATMTPVRELMQGHFVASGRLDVGGCERDGHETTSRIKAAVAFVQKVMAAEPGYAVVNPSVGERVRSLSEGDPGYIAHEYFASNWQPTSFLQVAAALGSAGLSWLGSADYRDHIDRINLQPAQRELLASIDDVQLREGARDLCVNRSFRRDYWVRQPRVLDADERRAALRAHRVMLAMPEQEVSLKVRGALGEIALPEGLYRPILRALSGGRVTTLGEIERGVGAPGLTLEEVIEAVTLLIGAGPVLNVQDDHQIQLARASARRLNAIICERAYESNALQFLVSPVSSSGLSIPRVAQLFLLAAMRGLTRPQQWAEFARAALSGLSGDDRSGDAVVQLALADQDLVDKAIRFADIYLPMLRMLGIDTAATFDE